MLCVFSLIKQCVSLSFHLLQERALRWIKPVTTSFVLGTLADLTRGKAELLAETALLRQQLIILRRQVKHPVCRKTDRLLLVLLARLDGSDLETNALPGPARDATALAS